jgi:hypothetical protein
MTKESDPSPDVDAHPEDPNRSSGGGPAPLDEAPDGHTPAEPTSSSADSLPPGAGRKPK